MGIRLTVLGSGSSGNASLLEVDGFGLLIDAGLGPRQIARRLQLDGIGWDRIHAVILTHAHGDHWREATLKQLAKREIPLYCHREHATRLRHASTTIGELQSAGLVRTYRSDGTLELGVRIVVRPFGLSHDCEPTFGFRIECEGSLFRKGWTLGYAADLGTWDDGVASMLVEADLLALEFNHDVALQRGSGRPPQLVARVLGDRGHLSNEQAAALFAAAVKHTRPGRVRDLVQLHLSRECNRPRLAAAAAERVLADRRATTRLHVASQDRPVQIACSD
ncbi:MAG: MBL fold metallo-hydrolase [Planctomycetales bacterium]